MPDNSGLQAKIDEIKDAVQDCNVNLLIGSGASSPFLSTLGNIEQLLQQLAELDIENDKKLIIRASIYKKLFTDAIEANLKVIEEDVSAQENLTSYKDALKTLNYLMLKRKSTILSKQINLFTSNYDIFLEKALDDTGLEYSDGFNGRFKPKYSLSNFKKSQFKKSLQYENSSEVPMFNLLKIHGSLTWINESAGKDIFFDAGLSAVKKVADIDVPPEALVTVDKDSTIEGLETLAAEIKKDSTIDEFINAYEELAIINPTKEKFKTTLLNQTYYEQLRIYSNELEKENTVLFVVGFSFADEHIREITVRAANSNPTLAVYIFSYKSSTKESLENNIDFMSVKNNNIKILYPAIKQLEDGALEDEWKYDLPTVNSMIFDRLLTPRNKLERQQDQPEDPLEA